jgi:hypothetical protein
MGSGEGSHAICGLLHWILFWTSSRVERIIEGRMSVNRCNHAISALISRGVGLGLRSFRLDPGIIRRAHFRMGIRVFAILILGPLL